MDQKISLPKGLLFLLIFLLFLTSFSASFFYYYRQRIRPSSKSAQKQELALTETEIVPSVTSSPTITPTPTTNWKAINVPEVSQTPAPSKEIAIPRYTYPSGKGKIRAFDINLNQNQFSSEKIIVYEKDIVRIYLTAVDKAYDLTVAVFGNKIVANPGETKMLEFQAAGPGSFSLTCQSCKQNSNSFGAKIPKGTLLIKPAS